MAANEEMVFDISTEGVEETKRDLQGLTTEFHKLNQAIGTYLALARRLGLPDNIDAALMSVQRVYFSVMAMYRAVNLMMMATGPIGIAIGVGGLAIGAIGFITSVSDSMEYKRPRR